MKREERLKNLTSEVIRLSNGTISEEEALPYAEKIFPPKQPFWKREHHLSYSQLAGQIIQTIKEQEK